MSQETLGSFTFKGTVILISFAMASIAASLLLNYFLGFELPPEYWGIIGVSILLMLPGGFYLGRALTQTFIINPTFEYDESTREETLKITEKTLLDLTDTLQKEQRKLSETMNVLEFVANQKRILLFFFLSGFAIAIVLVILLIFFSTIPFF